MPVASVIPASACAIANGSVRSCRAKTTVVAVDEYNPPSAAIHSAPAFGAT